jgi:predicted RecA/RadA family phage recombinase
MENRISEGNILTVTAPTGGVVGGQPFVFGQIPLIATTDAAEGEFVAAFTRGVFSLPVKGHDGTANAAITGGAQVYFDSALPGLNVNESGVPFGKVLAGVSSGATATVDVLV